MGLENLKSAFSDIELYADLKTDVTQMSSEHSIITSPQEVNVFHNDQVIGFTANLNQYSPSQFIGVSGDSPNMTFDGSSKIFKIAF